MKTQRTHLFEWQDRFVDWLLPYLGKAIVWVFGALLLVMVSAWVGVIVWVVSSRLLPRLLL